MHVVNTKRSLRVKTRCGQSLRPLVQDAVALSTQTDLPSFGDCKPETVKALTAMTLGFLQNVLSEDLVWLSMHSGRGMAELAGVPDKEYERVRKVMVKYWTEKKSKSPMRDFI